jgi:hypothetical protein
MKTKTTNKFSERNDFGPVMIFISSIGLSYAIVNQYVYDKPILDMLLIMSCFFLAGVFSVLRTKYTK